MRPATYHLSIRAARADALFASALQRSAEPTAGQVRRGVAEAIRAFGSRGCAERVAQEFGDHPETAAARMRWASAVTDEAFGARTASRRPARQPGRGRPLAACAASPVARAA
jgi:hypothetical protein